MQRIAEYVEKARPLVRETTSEYLDLLQKSRWERHKVWIMNASMLYRLRKAYNHKEVTTANIARLVVREVSKKIGVKPDTELYHRLKLPLRKDVLKELMASESFQKTLARFSSR